MPDERKPGAETRSPNLRKLLRVLVAGGVALAGAAGARAEEKPPPPASDAGAQPAQGGEQGKDQGQPRAEAKGKSGKKDKDKKDKQKADESKSDDSMGIKGW